jgi:ATP-dependent Clp protease adaptor protein ClpS
MSTVSAPMPVETERPQAEEQELPEETPVLDRPWQTVVWNDPVNLMSYVTYVFETYFGYSRKKAERLMLEVHNDGRSVVSTGSREEMERDVQAMHEYGLWATMERAT